MMAEDAQLSMTSEMAQSDIVIHEPCGCINACPAAAATSAHELRTRIVRHCSPTLAGMKCGSMFKMCDPGRNGIGDEMAEEMSKARGRGVGCEVLCRDGCGVLLYIYRPKLLAQRLSEPGVMTFLSAYGYEDCSVERSISKLKERFSECGMPPEVGIFLDYPLEDVVGYIENNGRGCRTIGCWKVYGDVEQAEKRFNSYRRCRDVFLRRVSEGVGLDRLAVRC